MSRTIFVTGANGFIGRRVVGVLRERGDEVVAMVRDPAAATALAEGGVRLVAGDLSSGAALSDAMAGADAVIHLAGVYRVGIQSSERPAMYEANVAVTERVLDAAIAAGIPRSVYVSTVNVFGDTHGGIPDETFRRDLAEGFISYYDETKYRAHVAAEARIGDGAPILIIQPGTVYGPGDHSAVGAQLKAAFDGTARYTAFADMGVSPTHVDDIAAGIIAALDRGRLGEAYILTAVNLRLREAMDVCARAAGRRLPRLSIPTSILRLGSRLAPGAGSLFGLPPNLREIVLAGDGVTYWGNNAKAVAELGFAPRGLEVGARDAYGPG
jgi:dihydroflavonol-4-reductase